MGPGSMEDWVAMNGEESTRAVCTMGAVPLNIAWATLYAVSPREVMIVGAVRT